MDWSDLKVFEDDNLNVTYMMEFVHDTVKDIVEKEEIADYQPFLPVSQSFQKPSLAGSLKVRLLW